MKIIKKCKFCDKPEQELTHKLIARDRHITLVCGHTKIEKALSVSPPDLQVVSELGKTPYHFQLENLRNIEELANGRALIADEMGLGKTTSILLFLKEHFKETTPALIVVKASLVRQWEAEIVDWLEESPILIRESKSTVPVFPRGIYIVSYDLLPRFKDLPAAFGHIKTLVLDECQQIKNSEASRTNAVREIAENCRFVIGSSGTPIKNSGEEFFPILNILRPEQFNNANHFCETYLQQYYSGSYVKYGGLNPYREAEFREKTKSFIFRHTREEVLPDLPKVRRLNSFHDLGPEVEEAYEKAMAGFMEAYEDEDSKAFDKNSNILAWMTRMRHLTGYSKVKPCVEFVEEFMEETTRSITIFVHHKDVAEILIAKLSKFNPLNLNSSLSGDERSNLIAKFRAGASRILIASTLASGEGLNLQFCEDCIMLERQWNPANEEQAEGRFTRIGSKASSIAATYFVATGTIDEFFATLVEQKRMYVKGTLDGVATPWNESNLMKELADTLASKGKVRFSLKAKFEGKVSSIPPMSLK